MNLRLKTFTLVLLYQWLSKPLVRQSYFSTRLKVSERKSLPQCLRLKSHFWHENRWQSRSKIFSLGYWEYNCYNVCIYFTSSIQYTSLNPNLFFSSSVRNVKQSDTEPPEQLLQCSNMLFLSSELVKKQVAV